jgi:very-short-patch-repair endonuclease
LGEGESMRDQNLLTRAKTMRRELTAPERTLWHALRAGRLSGAKFRRQVVIGRYIADFACRIPRMLVIEVDGDTHPGHEAYDATRTQYLRAGGYEVIRFTNADVTHNLDGVLMTIAATLALPLSPALSPEGEREKGR